MPSMIEDGVLETANVSLTATFGLPPTLISVKMLTDTYPKMMSQSQTTTVILRGVL